MTALDDARAALARLDDPKHGRDWSGWDYAADLEKAIRPLIAEHEHLTTPPTDDEREALAEILYPFFVRGDGLHDVVIAEQALDAILAAGFRRQGPITDAQVEAAWRAGAAVLGDYEPPGGRDLRAMRAALEAARDAS